MDGQRARHNTTRLPTWVCVLHCKMIRGFYGKMPGILLPVHLPLFLRASSCRTVIRNQDMEGLIPTALENTFVGLKGYMTK